jgi:hypothetical protein
MFWYDLKSSLVFKTKLKIYKEFAKLKNNIFIKKWSIGETITIFYYKLQKKKIKKSFIWKSYFGEKRHAILV